MDGWSGVVTVLAGALTSAFAVTRLSMGHQQATLDRFMSFLEGAVNRQEAQSIRFSEAIEELATGVREHTTLLRMLSDKLPKGGEP